MLPLITGPWSGIPNLLITLGLGLIVIIVAAIWADRFGKGYAPVILVALMAGLQMLVSFTSAKFVGLTFGGQTFFIIAGSLMYPLLACGEDYINEFYGRKLAKSSVLAQLIVRVLSTLFLIWVIYLPAPANGQANFDNFATLMGIVPRVAFSSIVATYIGGLLNVNIFAKLKENTKGRLLWLRVFVSTTVSLIVNAFIFNLLAFVGVRPFADIVSIIVLSVGIRLVTGFIELGFLLVMKYLQKSGLILQDTKDLVISTKLANAKE
jgi:queuosine precursor transporter